MHTRSRRTRMCQAAARDSGSTPGAPGRIRIHRRCGHRKASIASGQSVKSRTVPWVGSAVSMRSAW